MKLSWFPNRRRSAATEREPQAVASPPPANNGHGPQATETGVPAGFWEINHAEISQPADRTFYEMAVDVFFNARHFITFQGEPGPEHTHSYRLQAICRTQDLVVDDHVVIGFQYLRQSMTQVVNAYNNQSLNQLPPFQNRQPTTEVLAAILFHQLDRLLNDLGLRLKTITVWESPTEAITYGRNVQ